jgi:hypothetical protein
MVSPTRQLVGPFDDLHNQIGLGRSGLDLDNLSTQAGWFKGRCGRVEAYDQTSAEIATEVG